MFRLLKHFRRKQDGGALILWAFALIPLLGLVGMGIDVSLWYVYKRDAQSAADASALTAALSMNEGAEWTTVTSAANNAAGANGFAPDGTITVTVKNPPDLGGHAGDDDYVEVVIGREYQNNFISLFGFQLTVIQARAVAGRPDDPSEFCLLSLAPTGTGVTFTGTTDLVMNCGVAVTSTDSAALHVAGDAYVSVTDICVAGGTNTEGQPTYADAQPENDCTSPPNPLSGLAPPDEDVCTCDQTDYSVSGNGTTFNLSPGVYCNGIVVQGSNNTVNLAAGVYVMAGGGMTVKGGGNLVTGSGVMIYNTESCTGDDFGDITFEGATDVVLSGPESGDYKGIGFFNDPNPNNTSDFLLAGTVDTDFDATIYWPNPGSIVDYAGEALGTQSCGLKVIAYEVIFRGTSNNYTPDPSCANSSIPINGNAGGPVRLVE